MPLSITSITMSSFSRAAMTSIRPLPSSAAGTASMASVAFLMMLVRACEISRRSHCVGDVFAFDHSLRHPRKTRKFIDHPPDVVDLPHDRVGALLEDRLVLGDGLAELAANAFGRKLDRRQRILDFMGDTARDVGPCRGPLRGNELSDIIKRDDVAVTRLAGLLGADTNRKIALMAIAVDGDLPLYQPLGALPR